MQRVPIIANIYGYAVCLIAVLVFFVGTAVFIGGAFHAVHPTPFHPFVSRNIRIERGGAPGDMMWRERSGMHPGIMHPGIMQPGATRPGGMQPGATHPGGMPPAALPVNPLLPNGAFRATMLANARYAAIRRMTIALAMLVLAGVLFARHWRWLQAESKP